MKLLTVTVPCYNSQDYMDKCIDSILAGGDRERAEAVFTGAKESIEAALGFLESMVDHADLKRVREKFAAVGSRFADGGEDRILWELASLREILRGIAESDLPVPGNLF